jgi:uncharacterized damage-inducible protein DinB
MSGEVSEVERILEQLRRSHEGGAWHGPSLLEVVDGVDAATASRRSVDGAHTILDICLHVAAWEKEAIARLEGRGREDLPKEEDWPAGSGTGNTNEWEEAVESLESGHRSLAAAIRTLDDERLHDAVPGRPGDVYSLLHGIVQHNLYHAGQIAILKKGRA